MTTQPHVPAPRDGDNPTAEPRWLDADEGAAWMELVRLFTLLPQALDRQLRRDAGVSHVQYHILAVLSMAERRERPMSDLARQTALSLSRLSHAVAGLESRGWVRRRQSDQDGRVQIARLTDEGQRTLDAAAPGHVAEVRARVFDRLDPDEVEQLRSLLSRITPDLRG